MADIILHHYTTSPFAEKGRLAMGFKSLDWLSVKIPMMMPKPDLMPLTGGYRRTPVLQIGADIYCDTPLMLRALEAVKPAPSFYPKSREAEAVAVAAWIEQATFLPAVDFALSFVADKIPAALAADRRAFFPSGGFDPATMVANRASNLDLLRAHFGTLLQMLGDGRVYLLGDAPSAADLAAWHIIWFIHRNLGEHAGKIDVIAALEPWAVRMRAIGHGNPREISAADALDIAKAATPAVSAFGVDPADPHGLKAGDQIAVRPLDSGLDDVSGALVACSAQEIVLARDDARVGMVQVHFPRAGFVVRKV